MYQPATYGASGKNTSDETDTIITALNYFTIAWSRQRPALILLPLSRLSFSYTISLALCARFYNCIIDGCNVKCHQYRNVLCLVLIAINYCAHMRLHVITGKVISSCTFSCIHAHFWRMWKGKRTGTENDIQIKNVNQWLKILANSISSIA